MIRFQVFVNGVAQETADAATAVTLVADWSGGRTGDRVSLHVGDTLGSGASGERAVHWLSGRLRAGDEVNIRIVDVVAEEPGKGLPEGCSFCGTASGDVDSLIAGPGVAICSRCIALYPRRSPGSIGLNETVA